MAQTQKWKYTGNKFYDRVNGTVIKTGDVIESALDLKALHGMFELADPKAELSVLEKSGLKLVEEYQKIPTSGPGSKVSKAFAAEKDKQPRK